MNKRVYFNDKFIELIDKKNSELSAIQPHRIDETSKSKKKLNLIIEAFLTSNSELNVSLNDISLDDLISYFKEHHYYIEAAGGLIEKNNQFLFIRRHNRWDLPKGKLEKKEGIKEAAIRECEEECGIKNLNIIKPLNSTFHIYPFKNSFALKQSYWFYMRTDYAEKLIPQLEEDITEVKWFGLQEIKQAVLSDTYYTISDVAKEGLGL